MAEFHNFDVGDPDNLGMLIILFASIVFGIYFSFEQNCTTAHSPPLYLFHLLPVHCDFRPHSTSHVVLCC